MREGPRHILRELDQKALREFKRRRFTFHLVRALKPCAGIVGQVRRANAQISCRYRARKAALRG